MAGRVVLFDLRAATPPHPANVDEVCVFGETPGKARHVVRVPRLFDLDCQIPYGCFVHLPLTLPQRLLDHPDIIDGSRRCNLPGSKSGGTLASETQIPQAVSR